MIRIVIADDHPIVRDGLTAILERDPGIEVVGQASGGREAVTLVERLAPDVVLMDLRMPDGDGVAAITALRAQSPSTPRITWAALRGSPSWRPSESSMSARIAARIPS